MPVFRAKYRTPSPCRVCGRHVEKDEFLVWSRRNRGVFYHQNCFDSNKIEETVNTNGEVEVKAEPKPEPEVEVPQQVIEQVVEDAKLVHKNYALLLQLCRVHSQEVPVNVWLVGPAGSGKTKAAQMVAESMSLPFYFTGAINEPYSLLGYKDANGNYVSTLFRQAYENGGIFLMDEVDGSSPNALLCFNAALANGHCAFPDKVVERHKDCIIIAAANTFGLGGTSDYVGRVKLDAASLSRFVWVDWQYDEQLERRLSGNAKWADRVITIRANVKRLGLKILITPRATYTGAALLKAGIPQDKVEELTIKQGMTDEQWIQVSRTIGGGY